MLKSKFIFIFLGFVLASCSSTPKTETAKDDSAKGQETWEAEPTPMPEGAPASEGKSKEESKTAAAAVPATRDPWADLSAATKTQSDEAVKKAAERILARLPDDARALNALALVNLHKNKYDLAVYLLGHAIQKNPTRSELHSNLGIVELARHENHAAIQAFRKALELNSEDGVAAANLGGIYVSERDYTKAAIVLETAMRRGPRDAKMLSNYGIAMAATGHDDKALAAYSEALKQSPNSREVMLNQAILLVDHLGRFKDGLEIINRLKFLGPPPESRERLSLLENKAQAGVK